MVFASSVPTCRSSMISGCSGDSVEIVKESGSDVGGSHGSEPEIASTIAEGNSKSSP